MSTIPVSLLIEQIETIKNQDMTLAIPALGDLINKCDPKEIPDLCERIAAIYTGICTKLPHDEASHTSYIAAAWLAHGLKSTSEDSCARSYEIFINALLDLPLATTDFYYWIDETIYYGDQFNKAEILKKGILPRILIDSEYLDMKEAHMGLWPVTNARLSTQILAVKIWNILRQCDLYEGLETENLAISPPLPSTQSYIVIFKKIENWRGHTLYVSIGGEPDFLLPEDEFDEFFRTEFPDTNAEARIWENF